MHVSDQYYCVECGKLEAIEKAHSLFRTGFFKVIHPLGCCKACSVKKVEDQEAATAGEGELSMLQDKGALDACSNHAKEALWLDLIS